MARPPPAPPRRSALLPVAAVFLAAGMLAGCATVTLRPEPGGQGAPLTVVDASRLGHSREAACASLAAREVKDLPATVQASGMLPADFEALRQTVAARGQTVTFRDSNPACLPHLAAGVQSKGHDTLEKTWDASNLKPEDQDKAGLVSTLFKKPPRGLQVDSPQLKLQGGEPITCDYDLMDLFDEGGRRVRGETPLDLQTRAALNAGLPPTARGRRDRVMHGAQAAYGDYLDLHPEENVIWALFKPEAPLTAFGKEGKVHRLETVEDSLNLYHCLGAERPRQWRIEARPADVHPLSP